MEAVAAVATVVQLVEFSGQILAHGYGFLARVSGAPNEIRNLLAEVANVNLILDRVQELIRECPNGPAQTTLDRLIDIGALDNCRVQLQRCEDCLKNCKPTDGHGVANVGRRIKWAIAEKDVKSMIEHLRALQAQISQAISLDTAYTINRINRNTDHISCELDGIVESTASILEQREKDRVLRRISPEHIDLDDTYRSALRVRKGSTGQWLTTSSEFQRFLGPQESNVFWLSGRREYLQQEDPCSATEMCWIQAGSGKTVLCTTVIEAIGNNLRSPPDGLAYFYCGHHDPSVSTSSRFLTHTILHLIRCCPDGFKQLSENMPKHDGKLSQSDYLALAKSMLPLFRNVYIVIDALDESDDFEAMIRLFTDLLSSSSGGEEVRIVLTSREEIDIERALEPLSPIRMSTFGNVTDDIHSFIVSEVEERIRAKTLKLRDAGLRDTIQQSLFEAAGGIFLQARMQLDYVAGLKSDRAILNALRDLPSGLNEVYDQILAQLSTKPGYDPRLLRTILLWVSSSYTLMSTNEIAEASSMQPDDNRLDLENIATDPEDLVALCGSLLRVERSDTGSEPPLVGLVHHSAEEYLFSDHIAHGQLSYFGINYYESHLFLAKQCLQYLSFENFCVPGLAVDPWFLPDADILSLKRDHALLQYASLKWADHLRESTIPHSVYRAEILPLLPWFLKPGVKNNNYQVWQSIFHANCKHDDDCAHQTPFYVAIVQGLVHVVMTLLLDHMPEINAPFRNGWTPLTAALAADRVNVAHLLLSAGADPNVPANEEAHNGLSPLHVAAENNLELAVEMLLRSGASVHSRTYSKTTPLYRAARGGSLKVLTLLYENGSDINARTWDDWTPLIEATSCGRLEVVKKLLDWGADLSITTDDGHNAYDFADDDPELCSLLRRHDQDRRLRQGSDKNSMPSGAHA